MTIIARWQAVDESRVRERFARLGFDVDPDGRIAVAGGMVEIVHASRTAIRADEQLDAAQDECEPVDLASSARHPNGVIALRAVGLAVIDLERALAESRRGWRELPADRALGARAALLEGESVVLLEPDTEGRVAASLARFGPSPVALYLAVPGGLRLTAATRRGERGPWRPSMRVPGPFGPAVVVPGTPPWGPHLVAFDPSEPSSTIRR